MEGTFGALACPSTFESIRGLGFPSISTRWVLVMGFVIDDDHRHNQHHTPSTIPRYFLTKVCHIFDSVSKI